MEKPELLDQQTQTEDSQREDDSDVDAYEETQGQGLHCLPDVASWWSRRAESKIVV